MTEVLVTECYMEKANVCVYLLRDPRDNVARYVGVTHDPKTRLYQHWRDRTSLVTYYSTQGNKARGEWFLDMEKSGKTPVMDVLFTGLTRKQALRVESYILRQSIKADPARMKQHLIGLADPLLQARRAFENANPRARADIRDFFSVVTK